MVDRFPMTKTGYEALRQELGELKQVKRPKIIQAIAEARDHGDLSENAEYEAAKNEQGLLEAKISEIEGKLAAAEVIDPAAQGDLERVVFGVTVRLRDLDSDQEFTYQIVGTDEADVKKGKISVSSPIARALIGKEVTDVVTAKVPAGVKELEILDISC